MQRPTLPLVWGRYGRVSLPVAPRQGGLPGQSLAVGPGVVREDAFDAGDAVDVEERCGPGEEPGAGRAFPGRVDFAVDEAGVVVDGGLDVVEAHAADRPACLAAQGSVAAVVKDPAEFLHIDVDQLPRTVAFVAADHDAGGAVEPGQAVWAVAGQDAVHGRGGQAQDRADPGRPEPGRPSPLTDQFFDGGWGAVRRRKRPTVCGAAS